MFVKVFDWIFVVCTSRVACHITIEKIERVEHRMVLSVSKRYHIRFNQY